MKYFLYSIIVMVMGSCEEEQGELKPIKLNEDFTLAVGQTAILSGEGLSIRLAKIEDSRCPNDPAVNCVWEGMVVTSLVFKTEGEESSTEDDLNSFNKKELTYNGLKIELIDVSPYPKSTDEDDSKKIATFRITRPS